MTAHVYSPVASMLPLATTMLLQAATMDLVNTAAARIQMLATMTLLPDVTTAHALTQVALTQPH